jgi:cytosine/adenosine deaminase-related metal-dependent hydrolase
MTAAVLGRRAADGPSAAAEAGSTAADATEPLLIRGALEVFTGERGPAARAGAVDLRIRDGVIEEMAANLSPTDGERVLDAAGCVIYPGWVNTHHHLFQSLLKGVPSGLDQPLSGWLARVPYPRLTRFDADTLEIAVTIGLVELLLSGTTTCADHHYLYHRGCDPAATDVLFEVAQRLGVRLALCRGGATVAGDHPGYPADLVPESLAEYLSDVERLVGRYHQSGPRPMRQVVMAPTTPTYSVEPAHLREFAASARALGIRRHSHLSETTDYLDYCARVHGMRPVMFCAEHDWLGPDVWYAHLVHVDAEEIALLAETGTGIAHCPQSNCRLGSGIAPVPAMARAGVPISLGVDGPASNESADMIGEIKTAWAIHRAREGAAATRAEEVVHWASSGGAGVLGMEGIGTLAPGMAADLGVYELAHPRYFGMHDFALGPVLCGGSAELRYLFTGGRVVVEHGEIPGLDLAELAARAQAASRALA